MDIRPVIESQYGAVLSMLEQTVQSCPDELWFDESQTNRFWQVAYHALFYVHLYAQPTLGDFRPWPRHRDHYEMFGPPPWDPHMVVTIDEPYTKPDILAYLAFCRGEIARQLAVVDLDAPSGFEWLPFGKLELQIYSIRHVQQHTGELSGRLFSNGVAIAWIGQQPG